VKTVPLLNLVAKAWGDFLSIDAAQSDRNLFRKHERTGRPLGADAFIQKVERLLERNLKPRKPGPKPQDK